MNNQLQAYDLLNVNNLKVGMTESRHGMVDLRNVTAVFVTLPEEIAELLEEGNSNRRGNWCFLRHQSSVSELVQLVLMTWLTPAGDAGRCCKSSIFVIDLHQKDRVRRRKLHAELIFIEMNFSSSSVPCRCVTFDDMVNDEQRLMCRACSLQKQRIGHYVGRKPVSSYNFHPCSHCFREGFLHSAISKFKIPHRNGQALAVAQNFRKCHTLPRCSSQ